MRVLCLPRWACPDAGLLPNLQTCLCWARPHLRNGSDLDCAAPVGFRAQCIGSPTGACSMLREPALCQVLAKGSAEAWPGTRAGHMAREEADVLPLLEARLCTRQQRDMVWRTLRAMPLRLLERVLPWLAG